MKLEARNQYCVDQPVSYDSTPAKESEARQFGAFIQVFEKRKDENGVARISTMSYPLPPGLNSDQAFSTMGEILGPGEDNTVVDFSDYYRSASGELQFQAREGARFDSSMMKRFLDVPAVSLGIDQSKRREELVGGVMAEFNNGLTGDRHESAQASSGESIFAFSYRVGSDGLYGKTVNGVEGKKLSELALDGDMEHAEMLQKLEKRLMDMDEGVVINFDKSKTVSLCCAKFFSEKQGPSRYDSMALSMFGKAVLSSESDSKKTCKTCKQQYSSEKKHVCLATLANLR